ncbi:hypothetical protein ACFQAV_02040 [Companilactobacillus huachuanensis]|uniref:Helicase/UvrB N-terminal domain-containing protein n=1 Tax=Companilactobacillus huachuanensis TaxID=2559914 RepID=A0ABW1RL10_9LACO|nr:hypothetical protein [Companilactobacillus huachuanensis]
MNIKDFRNIVDNQIEGLTIVPLRTGSSKTYTAMDFISESNDSKYNRIIYITNRNNNLPIKELKTAFNRHGLADSDWKNKVLIVKSNFDSIVENLPHANIPSMFKSDVYQKLIEQIDTYKIHSQNNKNDDLKEVAKSYIENGLGSGKGLEKEFSHEIYIKLRSFAIGQLENTNSQLSIKECMLKAVREDKRFKWISTVYPTIFIEDYQILMMNTSKFLTSYNTVVGGAQQFLTAKGIIDNSLIIIDEFDQTKHVILNKIEDQAIKSVGDVFKDFQGFQQVFDCKISADLKKLQNPKMIKKFEEIKLKYTKIQNKYYTNTNWYLDEINSGHELMFFDGKLNTFLKGDSKKRLYSSYNSNNPEVSMKIVDKKEKNDDNISVLGALFEINGFYRELGYYFNNFARKYMENQAIVHSNLDIKIDYNNALSTITHIYKMDKKQSEIILNETLYASKTLPAKVFKYKTNSFYDYGLQLTFLENGINHNLSTVFNTYTIWDTPEKIMLYLAKKAHIVGLSATAGIKSNLSNYDLDYLKRFLGENFFNAVEDKLISEETLNELKKQDEEYSNQNINISSYSTEEISKYMDQGDHSRPGELNEILKKIVGENLSKDKIIYIGNGIQSRTTNDYLIKRYLEIIQAIAIFFENNNLESFLCLNNKSAKENDKKLDLNLLKDVFDYFNEENSDDAIMINLQGKNFAETKENIKHQLHTGKRVFVISTYQTMGDGQNLQYTPYSSEKLKCISTQTFSTSDQRYSKKDFDGLFLGEITYVTENLADSNFDVRNLLNCLFQIEYLFNSYEISVKEKDELITRGLQRMSDEETHDNFKLITKDSSRRKILTTVIQAVGRLNRTFNKNEICILISENLLNKLPYDDLKNMQQDGLLTKEMVGIFELLKKKSSISQSVNDKNRQNSARNRNDDCELFVYRILNDFNQTENRDAEQVYDDLREFVLKHPVLDERKRNSYSDYYFTKDGPAYWVGNEKTPNYYFKKNIVQEPLKEISERTSTLPNFMRNPIVHKYFIDNGWPTEFKTNGKIMCPYLFQFIYKAIVAEKAGIAILEDRLNIKLKRFSKEGLFEKFDYEFMDGQIVVDFKNWKNFDKDFKQEIKCISKKLDEVKGKKAFIINLIEDRNYHPYETNDERIVIVQSLMNKEGVLNDGNIRRIAKEIAQIS